LGGSPGKRSRRTRLSHGVRSSRTESSQGPPHGSLRTADRWQTARSATPTGAAFLARRRADALVASLPRARSASLKTAAAGIPAEAAALAPRRLCVRGNLGRELRDHKIDAALDQGCGGIPRAGYTGCGPTGVPTRNSNRPRLGARPTPGRTRTPTPLRLPSRGPQGLVQSTHVRGIFVEGQGRKLPLSVLSRGTRAWRRGGKRVVSKLHGPCALWGLDGVVADVPREPAPQRCCRQGSLAMAAS
jgi:hypothetical protein